MSDEVRQIRLTGPAAEDYSGGSKKERRTRSKKKGGADEDVHAPALPPNAPNAPNAPSAPSAPLPRMPASSPNASPSPPSSNTPPPNAPNGPLPVASNGPPPNSPNAPLQDGGAKVIRVELKKRATAKKVHLQPKKGEPKLHGKKQHTKKARKVLLGLSGLHKRMARAKKMTRKVKEMPLSQLREHLIQKKLIRPTSKAPESILRQIAADAQIVASKSL